MATRLGIVDDDDERPDDPRFGVVDRNCRVHGMANLYVAGSSVFGTPSYCNPTFTIVQLALRLGDHLGDTLPAATTTPAGAPEAPAVPEGSKP